MPTQEPTCDPITNLVSNAEPTSLRAQRRGFFHEVLTAIPIEPREDLERLCRAWLEATTAEWVWLWLQHESPEKRPWKLTAVACRSGKPEDYIPTRKEFVSIENEDSFAEFVS